MSKLTAEERNKLPDSAFAYIDRAGERHLPIHDEDHARNAIARYPRTDFESKAATERARKQIVAAAQKHGIAIDADDEIMQRAD